MSLINKELTEKNGYVIEFSIDKETYAKAELEAYKKNVKSMNVPGFRKGKAPMHVIKTFYGKEVFFEDAINACIPEAFEAAITEAGYDIVGNPKFDLVSMDGDIVLKAEGFVKPEVTIENYKGIEVEKKVVEISEDEINAEFEAVAKQYEMEVEKVKTMVPAEEIQTSLKTRKAVKVIVDNAKAKKPAKKSAAKKTTAKKTTKTAKAAEEETPVEE